MPTVHCFCQCHNAGSRYDPTHRCCVECPFCQDRIVISKFDDHMPICRSIQRPKPAPETD